MELGLVYERVGQDPTKKVDVYADASFAPGGGASHGGSITYVYGCPVSWKSRRQTVVSASTAESELIEAADAHLHARPIVLLLAELEQRVATMFLACDNSAAISMVGAAATHAWRSRHISIRGHLLDEAVRGGEVQFYFVGTHEQVADGLTKGLTRDLHGLALRAWHMASSP